jgi:putative CocE/NonD family hydrolase
MYLRSAGSANGSGGNGVLSLVPPDDDPADSFLYDPANPVPTVGGRTLFYHPRLGPPGVFDQARVEERDDVLVYTSARLSTPLAIAGPLAVKLYAASSCVETDFTAKLVDVAPSGFRANIAEGIIRARYRTDFAQETLLTPGEPTEFDIDLWASPIFSASATACGSRSVAATSRATTAT